MLYILHLNDNQLSQLSTTQWRRVGNVEVKFHVFGSR